MSTRCNIIIQDKYDTIMIYRHSDGYPDGECGVLAKLEQAFEFAWKLPRFEASDFGAALVRAWKEHGGNIRLCTGLEPSDDAEWLYTITADEHHDVTVEVASLGYPQRITATCPLLEAKELGMSLLWLNL